MEFIVHVGGEFRIAEPNYLGLPWIQGTTFHVRDGPRPEPFSVKAVERLPLAAIMDVNFADIGDERVGYLHYIRREADGWASKNDGMVSAAIVQLVRQANLGFLVFHTALMPDGQRLIERLRPAPFEKVCIEARNPRDTRPVWAVGDRQAITRHLLATPTRQTFTARWYQ